MSDPYHFLFAAKGGSKEDDGNNLLEMIAGAQGHRMNEQRAGASALLPGLASSKQPEVVQRLSVAAATDNEEDFPDETFFEALMKCQGSRIEDQRSSLPLEGAAGVDLAPEAVGEDGERLSAPTVPDEDFFNLIQRLQGGRLEDQRASLPS